MSQFFTSGGQSIYWSFSFSISPSNEYSGLISFRTDWFDLLGSFNFMAAVTVHSDFGAQENKSVTLSIVSPSICHEVMGPDAMILVF